MTGSPQSEAKMWSALPLDGPARARLARSLEIVAAQLAAADPIEEGREPLPVEQAVGELLFLTHLELSGIPAIAAIASPALRRRRESLIRSLDGQATATESTSGVFYSSVGAAWALSHVIDAFGPLAGPSEPSRALDAVRQELRDRLANPAFLGHYDVISGLAGITPFVVRHGGRELMESLLDRFSDLAEPVDSGVRWSTPPEYIIEESMQDPFVPSYNLGMAHGVFGVVVALSSLLAATASGRARALLEGTLRWTLAQEVMEPAADPGFPRIVCAGVEQDEPTRLAWCYGDLSAAVALALAADVLARPSLAARALHVGRRTLMRDPAADGVVDACFCHGSAGVAHLYHRLHHYTRDTAFQAAAVSWHARTERFIDPTLSGFQVQSYGKRGKPELGLVTGASGIGLALLAALTDTEPRWDSLLGLSLPVLRPALTAARGARPSELVAHATFMVRTPTSSFARYLELANAEPDQLPRRALDRARADPAFQEALWLADRALYSQIFAEAPSDRALQALVHYLIRASTRCTPFGLFAGCALGRVARATRMVCQAPEVVTRTIRPSMRYLQPVVQRLLSDWQALQGGRLFANTTATVHGDYVYYTRRGALATAGGHFESRLRSSAGVGRVLELCAQGATVATIQAELLLDEASVRRVITGMLDAGILHSELEPAPTGASAAEQIARHIDGEGGAILAAPQHVTFTTDTTIDARVAWYEAYGAVVMSALRHDEPCRDFHVEFSRDVGVFELDVATVDEILATIALIESVSPRRTRSPLERFAEHFERTFGEGPIRVLDAVNPRLGIGYPVRREGDARNDGGQLAGIYAHAYSRWLGGSRDPAATVHLTRADFERYAATESAGVAPIPAMTALCRLYVDADGRDLVAFDGAVGPSSAMLLARFHGLSGRYEALIRDLVEQETGGHDAPLYAEVIQWPGTDAWDIAQRPALRSLEIPVLGLSSARGAQRLLLSDLYLQVVEGRLIMTSGQLRREVMPCLTNAHNYQDLGVGSVYKFLCDFPSLYQRTGVRWDWGGEQTLSYYPRVQVGRVIVACARWRLDPRLSPEMMATRSIAQFEALLGEWCSAHAVPRFVYMESDEADLFIDRRNVYCVRTLWTRLRAGRPIVMTEALPGDALPALTGAGQAFFSELLLPVRRRGAPSRGAPRTTARTTPVRHPPGGEWMYLQVHGGPDKLDHFLTRRLAQMIFQLRSSGALSRWFFVRYDDPVEHCRVRLQGDARVLADCVLPPMTELLAQCMADGQIDGFTFATYLPEEHRYGGQQGLELCELLFCADSETILYLLGTIAQIEDARVVTACYLADSLLRAFALQVHARLSLVSALRESHMASLGLPRSAFKKRRSALGPTVSAALSRPWGALSEAERSRENITRKIGYKLRDLARNGELTVDLTSIIASLVHMTMNRWFTVNQASSECQVYDLLWASYRGEFVRSLRTPASDQ